MVPGVCLRMYSKRIGIIYIKTNDNRKSIGGKGNGSSFIYVGFALLGRQLEVR